MKVKRSQLPLGSGVRVVESHPAGLLALEKPAGLRSHPNKPGADPRALLTCPYNHSAERYTMDSGGFLYLLNRLDSPTSGLILCATDAGLAEQVKALFAQHKVSKLYHALVKGAAQRLDGVWRDRIEVTRQRGGLRAAAGRAGDFALTKARRTATGRGEFPCTLLALSPETGRSHQLRVQCARRGLPIIGDATYGDFRLNRRIAKATGLKRLFLHSGEVSLSLKYQGQTVNFKAVSPLPPEFNTLLDYSARV